MCGPHEPWFKQYITVALISKKTEYADPQMSSYISHSQPMLVGLWPLVVHKSERVSW